MIQKILINKLFLHLLIYIDALYKMRMPFLALYLSYFFLFAKFGLERYYKIDIFEKIGLIRPTTKTKSL